MVDHQAFRQHSDSKMLPRVFKYTLKPIIRIDLSGELSLFVAYLSKTTETYPDSS